MSRANKKRTKGGKVDAMRQDEANQVLEEEEKRDDEQSASQREKNDDMINGEDVATGAPKDNEYRSQEAANGKKEPSNQWAPSEVIKFDIRRDEGILYHPLRTSTGAIVSMSRDKLRIGKRSEQKLKNSPRFNGKVVRCPGNYYVLDSETKHEVPVYPHIMMIAYFLRYKMTKCLDSSNVKLSVKSYNCFVEMISHTFFSSGVDNP